MEKIIKNLIYHKVKYLAKICTKAYYRGIEINGKENIPTDGSSIIYAVNHQNAFIDAIIVGALSPIPTHFMTRSDVFVPPYDWYLDALKMMPIYRIRDGYGSLSKNEEIFLKCSRILESNEAIMIFPEGNHGLEYFLRPLTKGISRIAIQTQLKLKSKLAIVPIGLNYFDHLNSGHKLILNYGKPVYVDEYISDFETQNHQGLIKLTKAISHAMQPTLLIPTESENYVEQKKCINRHNEILNFRQLKAKIKEGDEANKCTKYPFLASIGNLFSLPNLPLHALVNWILNKKVSQVIFSSSIKIAIGILIFPLWLLFIFLIISLCCNLKIAAIVTAFQVLCWFIRRELRRLGRC